MTMPVGGDGVTGVGEDNLLILVFTQNAGNCASFGIAVKPTMKRGHCLHCRFNLGKYRQRSGHRF